MAVFSNDPVQGICKEPLSKKRKRPNCTRWFSCIPSKDIDTMWSSNTRQKQIVPDIADYARMMIHKHSIPVKDIPQEFYNKAYAECTNHECGSGMYPEWITKIPTLVHMIDKRIEYCDDPKLYHTIIKWQGLPYNKNYIDNFDICNPYRSDCLTRAHISISQSRHNQENYFWFVSLSSGRASLLTEAQLKIIFKEELRRPIFRRRDFVQRSTRTEKVLLPFMPSFLRLPQQKSKSGI